MLHEIITELRQNKAIRIGLIVALVVIAGLIVLSIVTRPRFSEYNLTTTPLNTSTDFGFLKGDLLYGYSGIGFYSIDIKNNNKLTVLHSGTKLPTPSHVYWADSQGALLNFASSFTYTPVADKIKSEGNFIDETTQAYTWYFDFKSGQLHRVSKASVHPGFAYYSESARGFYYLPQTAGGTVEQLRFYSITENRDRQVISGIGLVDVSHIGPCHDKKYGACIIARNAHDTSKISLYGFTSEGKQSELLSATGRIIPTNNSRSYLYANLPEEEVYHESHGDDHEESVDLPNMPLLLYDVASKKSADIDLEVSTEPFFTVRATNQETFSVIGTTDRTNDGNAKSSNIIKLFMSDSGKSSQKTLQSRDGKTLGESIVSASGYGNGGYILVNTAGGSQVLVGPRSDSIKSFGKEDTSSVKTAVGKCSTQLGASTDYYDELSQFKTYFKESPDLAKHMRTFTDCVIKENPNAMPGYTYYMGVTSAQNGRFISD